MSETTFDDGHYHFSAQLIKRSQGQSSVAAAAYRAGQNLIDERTGERHDYRKRGGVVHHEILLPQGAPEWMLDRERLWNHVEKVEVRRDAQLAREINFGLPHQLSETQRLELVRKFLQHTFVVRGMVADFAIHTPQPNKGDDPRNHHAHVMLSLRRVGSTGFYRTKTREWNSDKLLCSWREQWAAFANDALERANSNVRVDHRSLKDRGIDRTPQLHQGRRCSSMAAKGLEPGPPSPGQFTDIERTYVAEYKRADARKRRWMRHPRSPWARVRRSLMYKTRRFGLRVAHNYRLICRTGRTLEVREQELRAKLATIKQDHYDANRQSKRTQTEIKRSMAAIYKQPESARKKYQQAVEKSGFEKALQKLVTRPGEFGDRRDKGLLVNKTSRQQAERTRQWLKSEQDGILATLGRAVEMRDAISYVDLELARAHQARETAISRQASFERRYKRKHERDRNRAERKAVRERERNWKD